MPVFVDTGGWFAYFIRRDPDHTAAVAWMRENRQPLLTTDYVLDELFTLLRLRESHRVAVAAGGVIGSNCASAPKGYGDRFPRRAEGL
jgi:predicted nucleic acid-binding protein